MSAPSPATLWRTLRALRPRQAWHQGLHLLGRAAGRRVRPVPFAGPPPTRAAPAPAAAFLPAPPHARLAHGRLTLLSRAVDFGARIDWDHAAEGPLWAFHLHQFDWARDPALAPMERARHLLDWVERHRKGVGWQPGPISLRALSWLKLLTTPGALELGPEDDARVRASLASQLDTLARHLEVRLLANHYLSNLLALVAGGVALAGPAADAWLRHAPALREELREQVLPDGAHVERSPMYHALLLENVLDLLAWVRAAPQRAPAGLEGALADVASRMRGALRVYTHPDGQIALVADAALGVAHPPAAIERYADSLGVEARGPARAGVLDAAGYVRLERGSWSLLVSTAGPMPAYQPGHAHADALAFELCVDGRRVVTDTGVCEYVPGLRRDRARATASHATLEVGGYDQAELWAGHRVGGRPRVELVSAEPPDPAAPGECAARIEATCVGWATPDTVHRRRIELDANAVVVTDTLEGRVRPARLTLPLAPGIRPVLARAAGDPRADLTLPEGGRLALALPSDARWRVEPLDYYPEFGVALSRAALVGEAEGPGPFVWRCTRGRS